MLMDETRHDHAWDRCKKLLYVRGSVETVYQNIEELKKHYDDIPKNQKLLPPHD